MDSPWVNMGTDRNFGNMLNQQPLKKSPKKGKHPPKKGKSY